MTSYQVLYSAFNLERFIKEIT